LYTHRTYGRAGILSTFSALKHIHYLFTSYDDAFSFLSVHDVEAIRRTSEDAEE